jgi:lipoate-protein ligase A
MTLAPVRNSLRLLQDPALDGPANMARDEALLHSVGASESLPTLRLYEWKPPTISLGYFQPVADYEKLDAPLRELPVVRRPTGGGAILHDLELTYSLTVPAGHPWVTGNPRRLYELAHAAVIETLAELNVTAAGSGVTDDSGAARGPFFCFARRHALDVVVGADKIAGSAQRRTKDAILQHGSIVLASRFAQHPTAILDQPFESSLRLVRSRFPARLAERAGAICQPADWTKDELAAAARLAEKYSGDAWTRRV